MNSGSATTSSANVLMHWRRGAPTRPAATSTTAFSAAPPGMVQSPASTGPRQSVTARTFDFEPSLLGPVDA
eukprot:691432-Lingulodinium_polyedra.AAC.1